MSDQAALYRAIEENQVELMKLEEYAAQLNACGMMHAQSLDTPLPEGASRYVFIIRYHPLYRRIWRRIKRVFKRQTNPLVLDI